MSKVVLGVHRARVPLYFLGAPKGHKGERQRTTEKHRDRQKQIHRETERAEKRETVQPRNITHMGNP